MDASDRVVWHCNTKPIRRTIPLPGLRVPCGRATGTRLISDQVNH